MFIGTLTIVLTMVLTTSIQAPGGTMELSIKARLLGVCAQVMLDGSMPPIALPVVRGLYLAASRDLPPLDNDIKACGENDAGSG